MTATAPAPPVPVARRRGSRDAAGAAHRLLPRPLLVVVTAILLAMVLVLTSEWAYRRRRGLP